eukprot:gene6457-8881_t
MGCSTSKYRSSSSHKNLENITANDEKNKSNCAGNGNSNMINIATSLTIIELVASSKSTLIEIQSLLEKNPESKHFTLNGNNLLHLSVNHNKINIISYLINGLQFDINAQNSNGDTPLHIAVSNSYFECAMLLRTLGCDENIKNLQGFRAKYGMNGTSSYPNIALQSCTQADQILAVLDICELFYSDLDETLFIDEISKIYDKFSEYWKENEEELYNKMNRVLILLRKKKSSPIKVNVDFENVAYSKMCKFSIMKCS